jgi:hypothetical protein
LFSRAATPSSILLGFVLLRRPFHDGGDLHDLLSTTISELNEIKLGFFTTFGATIK